MTTRWRRRQMCVLVSDAADVAVPCALRTLSARTAFLETSARPALGETVELRHPDAGTVAARVDAHHADGIALRLDGSIAAVAFALAAIAAEMTRPASA